MSGRIEAGKTKGSEKINGWKGNGGTMIKTVVAAVIGLLVFPAWAGFEETLAQLDREIQSAYEAVLPSFVMCDPARAGEGEPVGPGAPVATPSPSLGIVWGDEVAEPSGFHVVVFQDAPSRPPRGVPMTFLVSFQNGAEREAKLVGADPRLGIAVLRVEGASPVPAAPLATAEEQDGIRGGSRGIWIRIEDDGGWKPVLATVTGTGANAQAEGRSLDGLISVDRQGKGLALLDTHGRIVGLCCGSEALSSNVFTFLLDGSVSTPAVPAPPLEVEAPLRETHRIDPPLVSGDYEDELRSRVLEILRESKSMLEIPGDPLRIGTELQWGSGSRLSPKGYAVPAGRIRESVCRILAGSASHAWLGIWMEEVDPAAAGHLGIEGGALVTRAASGSPAEAAGLQPRDILVSVGGREVRAISGVRESVEAHKPGEEIVLVVLRRGERITLRATLGEAPEEPPVVRELFDEGPGAERREVVTRGTVLEVTEDGVLLDLGRENGVGEGDRYALFRGDRLVGEVDVVRVFYDAALCRRAPTDPGATPSGFLKGDMALPQE